MTRERRFTVDITVMMIWIIVTGVFSDDRLDHLESCVGKDASPDNKLTAIFQKCKSEKEKATAIRFCMIKNTLRTDLEEITKLLWCLFES